MSSSYLFACRAHDCIIILTVHAPQVYNMDGEHIRDLPIPVGSVASFSCRYDDPGLSAQSKDHENLTTANHLAFCFLADKQTFFSSLRRSSTLAPSTAAISHRPRTWLESDEEPIQRFCLLLATVVTGQAKTTSRNEHCRPSSFRNPACLTKPK